MKIMKVVALIVLKIKKVFNKSIKEIVVCNNINCEKEQRINHMKYMINSIRITRELNNIRTNINEIDKLVKDMLDCTSHNQKELVKRLGEP
jgi:hypothetical protein